MSEIEIVSQEIRDILLKKVGNDPKKLRTVLRYYKYNIPEVYWFKSFNHPTDTIIENMELGEWVVVLSNNQKHLSSLISDVLKVYIKKNQSVYFQDFFELASRPNFDGQAYNKMLHTLQEVDVVGFTNIKYGEVFNKNSEQFALFCQALQNAQFKKTVIFGIESTPKDDTENGIIEYYSNFGEFIDNNKLGITEL